MNTAEAQRQPQINAQINNISDSLSALEKQESLLRDRLQSVYHSNPTPPDAENIKTACELVPLAEELHTINNRIQKIASDLSELQNNIEL